MITLKKPEWFFYPAWILCSMICIPIALGLDLIILRIIVSNVGDIINVDGVRHITEDYLAMYPFIPIVALLTGLLQYGLLRRYLPRMGWWVLAATAGWLMGALLILISIWLRPLTTEFLGIALVFVELGFSIGVGQRLLLRRRLSRAGWWIGANVVGWFLLSLMTVHPLYQFDILVVGLLPPCVTAVVFYMLLNQVQPTEPLSV